MNSDIFFNQNLICGDPREKNLETSATEITENTEKRSKELYSPSLSLFSSSVTSVPSAAK